MRDGLGFDPRRVGGLAAPLTDLAVVVAQQPIHRGLRAQVGAFVEQDRVHLTGREVDEPVLMEHGQDLLALGRAHAAAAGARVLAVSGPVRCGASGSGWPGAVSPPRRHL